MIKKWNHAPGSEVSWGTAPQIGRSSVRFPTLLLQFFIDVILQITL